MNDDEPYAKFISTFSDDDLQEERSKNYRLWRDAKTDEQEEYYGYLLETAQREESRRTLIS